METSTKILIGLGVAATVAVAVSYVRSEQLVKEAQAAQALEQERARRKEERFLMSVVKNYRLDHALLYGNRPNINYVLLDTIIDREIKLLQLVDLRTGYCPPTIKAQAHSAQLVGRFGVTVEVTPVKFTKS